MPRRVGLPGASELFRHTGDPAVPAPSADAPVPVPVPDQKEEAPEEPRPTGRIRHEEKITVYVSSDELLALERLRIDLRAEHGLAVDRGRIVRAAIASALAQINAAGVHADVVRRLADS